MTGSGLRLGIPIKRRLDNSSIRHAIIPFLLAYYRELVDRFKIDK